MPEFELAIRGGTIVDGARTPRYRADLGIAGGRIRSIGRIREHEAARTLDASGMIVAPGFVDLHTHYDSQLYWDPWCSLSGWHGVTSVVIGNCGFGFAPVRPADRDRAMLTMARNEAVPLECMQQGMPWDWETLPQFLDSLERTAKGVNVLSYVGLNPVMMYEMGLEAAKTRRPSEDERARMCATLREAIAAGACGFSAQLFGEASVQRDYDGTPMITDTMAVDDLLAFARTLGECRKGFIQISGATPKLTEKLAEASGRPVIWNLIAVGRDQHGMPTLAHKKALDWLASANARGLRIFGQALTCDVGFTFTFEDWNLFDTSPAWRAVTLGSPAERAQRMRDPQNREALKREYDAGHGPVAGGGTEAQNPLANAGVADLLIEAAESPALQDRIGLTVGELARRTRAHPVDALLDLILADDLRTTFTTPPQETDRESLREVATSAFALPGLSDGGAHTKFSTLGAYPTEFLTVFIREHEMMSLEEAHWRLSAYPALAAGLEDRGVLREGAPADVVVYDFEKLRLLPQAKAWDFPANQWRRIRKADGYRYTVVNGRVTFENSVCTGATPGRLLRHGRA
jgi:N-acyl-D-aspartate/D-glutamate deacylase